MKREVIKYGLKLKESNELLQYDTQSLGDMEFSVDIQHSLTTCGEKDWLVDDYDKALYVMFNTTEYYNAYYETPINDYKPEELEIVKVKMIIEETPMAVDFIKIKLKKQYNKEHSIPYYNGEKEREKEITFMKNKIGYAIDKGDYYRIVRMYGVSANVEADCKFSKEYFDVVG